MECVSGVGGCGAGSATGKYSRWGRLTGEHKGRHCALAAETHQALQHRLVAAVVTGEIADRQHAGLALSGRGQAAKDLHRESVGGNAGRSRAGIW